MTKRLGDFFRQRQEPGIAGLPVMSVTMNDSLVLRDGLERRTESALRPDQHLLVKKGDIAYNMMRMWQGACGLAASDGVVSPAYVVLTPSADIDSQFAYHWFKSDRMIHLFWAYSHGLTEDRLRLYFDAFAEIPASPPSLEQQRRIAAVLGAWDAAIAQTVCLINAQRKRLGEISKLLFERPNPHQTTEDELGLLRIGEVADCFSGGTPDSADASLYGGGIPWVKSSEVASANIVTTEETLTEAGLSSSSAKWVPSGSCLIAMYGANAGQVGRLGINATTNQAVLAVVPNTETIDPDYLYYSIIAVIPSLMRKVQGSGQPNLNAGIVKDEKLLIPSKTRQRKIAETAQALEATVCNLQQQLDRLHTQKRGLMQRLLTGEWRLDGRFDSLAIESPPLARSV